MLKYLTPTLFFYFAISLNVHAQLTAGLTRIPDTSFTTRSAWQGAIKKYPFITYPKAPTEGMAYVEKFNIQYVAREAKGLQLDAFYPQPEKNRRVPAIVIIHGGGWRSGDRSQHYVLAQHLASKGYACFTVQYRLSTDALYPAAIRDLKTAVKWIRKHADLYKVNPNKIAALGFSAGGELAAFLGVTNQQIRFDDPKVDKRISSDVQAVIDIDGTLSFVHPESGEGDDSKKTSASTYWFGYNRKENLALLTDGSPLTHVGKNTPPFLFLNSSVERMHAGRDDFRKVLKTFNIYSEVFTFESTPHTFCLFEPWFTETVSKTDQFMRKVFSR